MKNYLLLSALPIAAFAAGDTNIITNRPSDQGMQNSAQKPIYYDNEPEVSLDECCEKREMMPMYPASARMQIACGLNLVFMGDFLYLKAKEDNLEYAVQSPNTVVDTIRVFSGNVHRVNTEYKPGFRVGMGLLIPHDQWDIYFTWTRYQFKQHSSLSEKADAFVLPLLLNEFQNPISADASAKWNVDFNTGDVEVGKSFFVGRYCTLRPFAGARGAWIHQGLDAKYGNVRFLDVPNFTVSSVTSDNDSSFRAFGLRFGVDADWEFGEGWGLFLNGAASLLWSEFNITQTETLSSGIENINFRNDFHAVTPVFDMAGGLAWGHYLFKHRYFVKIHAAWEEQVWFNQNRFCRMVGSATPAGFVFNEGNFSLSGLNVGITLGF